MATAIQWRRGNTSQHANFTGLVGEITVDTDLNTVIVHDGSTAGGHRIAKYSEVQAAATGDITAVNTNSGSGLTGGVTSGEANIAIDYENLTGNLIPSANNTYSLGNATSVWKDVFVGPGSLYVNGQQVLSDASGTIQLSADTNQNISILTLGSGDIELTSGGEIQIKSNLVMSAGKTISTAGGGATSQTSNIDMNSNYINNLGTPVASTDAATKGYVDTDSTVVRTTGTQTIGGAKTFSDDAVFSGNLTVSGTQTIINTETLTVDDNIIVLNNNATGSASQNAGIEVERGDDANKQLLWNETSDKWTVGSETFVAATFEGNLTGDVTGTVSDISNHNTGDLAEGSNLYWTTARGNSAIDAYLSGGYGVDISSGAISVANADVRGLFSASGDLSYNASTGVFSFTNDAGDIESVTAGSGLTGGGTSGDVTLNIGAGTGITVNADDIQVNSTYIKSLFSASDAGGDGSFAYNDGLFTYTGPSAAEVRAHFSAAGDLSYNSSTGVFSFTNDLGDIESVTAGSGLTGGGTSGNVTLNIGAGTGITVNADDIAVNMAAFDTDDLAEGVTNQYFTNARAQGAITVTDAGGDGSLAYSGGTITYTGPSASEVRAHFSAGTGVTLSSGQISIGQTVGTTSNVTFDTVTADLVGAVTGNVTGNLTGDVTGDVTGTVSSIANHSTSDLSEGTNLYYTTARANSAMDAYLVGGAGLTKSSGTFNVGAGSGITVNADTVQVDSTVVRTTGTQTIGGAKTFSDDMVLSGNLTVNGTQTIMNTTVASLADNIVELNRDASGAPSEDAGLQVNRGSSADVFLKWDETADAWMFTNDGSTYEPIPVDTDDLGEGSTNLYFTNARADARVNAQTGANLDLSSKSTTDLAEGTNLYYTVARANTAIDARISGGNGLTYSAGTLAVGAGTGITVNADNVAVNMSAFSTSNLSEGSNLYWTTARGNTNSDAWIATKDTGDLAEGVNLYYTTARANSAMDAYLTGGTGITISSGTISLTDTGYISGVTAGNGLTGGGTSGNVTLNVVDGYGIDVAADSVSIANAEVRALFSATGDLAYNASTGVFSFTNDAGDIESVSITAGTGLSGGGTATSGAASFSLAVDLSELTDMTAAMTGTDEFIVLDAGADRRKAANEIGLSIFNNDAGFTTNVGDITGVTAGTGLTGGGASGSVTLNVDMSAFSTTDLSEGSNLYWTVARGNSAIDARVTTAYVNALAVNATTLDSLDSTAFLRSNAADTHSGTITPSTNNAINLGSASLKYANVYATTFQGTATSAQYADLAEKYESDMLLEAGTVVCFGGEKEITACSHDSDHRVAGVISTDPAFMMNSDGEGQYVALTGRVPCKVVGPVAKGDLLVSSDVLGHARADNDAKPGRIIGKAVGSIDSGEGVIEVLVNMM